MSTATLARAPASSKADMTTAKHQESHANPMDSKAEALAAAATDPLDQSISATTTPSATLAEAVLCPEANSKAVVPDKAVTGDPLKCPRIEALSIGGTVSETSNISSSRSSSFKRSGSSTRSSAKRQRATGLLGQPTVSQCRLGKKQLQAMFKAEQAWIPKGYRRHLRHLGVPVALRREIVLKMWQVLAPFVQAGASKEALPFAVMILDRYLNSRRLAVPSSMFIWKLCGACLVLASKYAGRAPLHLASLAFSMSLDEAKGAQDFKVSALSAAPASSFLMPGSRPPGSPSGSAHLFWSFHGVLAQFLERELILALDWDLHAPSPYDFVALYLMVAISDFRETSVRDYEFVDVNDIACELCDVAVSSLNCAEAGPSAVAAICTFLAVCGATLPPQTATVSLPALISSRRLDMFGIRPMLKNSVLGNGAELDVLLDHICETVLTDVQFDDGLGADAEPLSAASSSAPTPVKRAPSMDSPTPATPQYKQSELRPTAHPASSPGPPRRKPHSMELSDASPEPSDEASLEMAHDDAQPTSASPTRFSFVMADEVQVQDVELEQTEEFATEIQEVDIKLFGKWSLDVEVEDISLADYIAVSDKHAKFVPHTAGRYAKQRFRKAQCPIVERMINSLMMHGRNNGKKLMTTRIVRHTLEIIHLTTGENPVQILVSAVANSGAREDSTRIGRAGTVRRQSCDVSPLRRVNQAVWLLTTGARQAAFRNIKTIAECLADELINAAKGSSNSYAIKKKDELERVAKSNR
ncbi:uncharacterized protein MONBRDRAFT_37245 [Monosiga brevicollis MX1]|uniref:Small ribosomal subunit protein uS7 domain-containing protein n=1 Tax=Monosiga brevicollis TaxID=81824 RepID=A9V0I7_MONBE|nr:uncharacterized protein MONBRDRAFT_37245 [Monosiga brevicollis MX1]EDQ89022.1 predicted protein [Monosiga brevicollis MX1]|eukprot:XP_001746127.1 hypothetical protein [Monosiga brevicollis MX1]